LFITQLNAQTINIQSNDADKSLPHIILKKALEHNNFDISYLYQQQGLTDATNSKILHDLQSGDLDVMWSMTSKSLEQQYQAVYIPIFRGLLGMRIAIVKAQNANLLSKVKNLNDLKRFSAGQGKFWPDSQILEANDLKVVKTLKYVNLFYMLEGERFDYYPRGLNEPWDEVERYKDLNLVVDSNVLIRYRAPLYFFVKKSNQGLAQILDNTLNQMVNDGSFNRLFFANEQITSALELSNVTQRVLIDLDNPLLSDETPLNRSELWFDPIKDIPPQQ
jgi:hypothetical protein